MSKIDWQAVVDDLVDVVQRTQQDIEDDSVWIDRDAGVMRVGNRQLPLKNLTLNDWPFRPEEVE